jgi:hypothetical protein
MRSICSGQEVARPQARLLPILVRVAGAQQSDPGVLVEFGGHPGMVRVAAAADRYRGALIGQASGDRGPDAAGAPVTKATRPANFGVASSAEGSGSVSRMLVMSRVSTSVLC